jgi:hypothetical protein
MASFLIDASCLMQKLLIISLLGFHLFGNTEFSQVLHIPLIAAHYYHHVKSGDKISFLDFVSEHYGKGDNDPSDDKDEENLPFMQVHQHAFSIAILPVTQIPSDNNATECTVVATRKVFFKLPIGFFGLVHKPPRLTC